MDVIIDPLDLPRYDSEDISTLIVLRRAGSILMGRKQRGYGIGKLVLPGGKVNYTVSGEGLFLEHGRVNASRELAEEAGVRLAPSAFTHMGGLLVETEDDDKLVDIFTAECPPVTPTPSSELSDVAWYDENRLPYADMPTDYELWLPHLLSGHAVLALLESNGDELVSSQVFRRDLRQNSVFELT